MELPGKVKLTGTTGASHRLRRIGFKPFAASYDALLRLGYAETGQKGHLQHLVSGFDGTGEGKGGWQKATRFRQTAKFCEVMASRGLDPSNWSTHFALVPDNTALRKPIVLRGKSTRSGANKFTGSDMPVYLDGDVTIRELADAVIGLNTYFDRQKLVPPVHVGFHRIFNQGDQRGFNWNKGGRLYSIGGGYQSLSKQERLAMTINGAGVAEIDLTASHLTILHALRGIPFDPATSDPYEIEGLPRSLVKTWVTMTLGHTELHTRWPREIAKKFAEKESGKLQTAHPLATVRDAIVSKLPALADWANCPVDCFDLQYVESCIMFETVERLAIDHDVPAYVVHDSLIVPKPKVALAKATLSKSFSDRLSVLPAMSVSMN